jgi:hypothetical protein
MEYKMNPLNYNYQFEFELSSLLKMRLEVCSLQRAKWNIYKHLIMPDGTVICDNNIYKVQLKIPRLTPQNESKTKDFEVLISYRKLHGQQGVAIIIPATKWRF